MFSYKLRKFLEIVAEKIKISKQQQKQLWFETSIFQEKTYTTTRLRCFNVKCQIAFF